VPPPKGVTGAWLLHHDQKLLNSKKTDFESIAIAGCAAGLLSAISKEDDWSVPNERVVELARGIGIRKHELNGLLSELSEQGLIDQSNNGVSDRGDVGRRREYRVEIETRQKLALPRCEPFLAGLSLALT
jgi:hypothetical protein